MRSEPGVNHSMSPFQWFHSAALLWRWHAAAHVVEQKKKEDRTCNPLTMECICQCTTAHTRRTPVFSCRRLQQQRCWPGVDLAWAVPWGRVHWHHCCTTSRGTAGRRPPQRGPWTGLWQLHAGLCWTMFSTSWGTWERKGKRLPVKDLKEQHTYIWNCGEGCARSRHKSIGQGPRADCTGQCPHPAPGPRERKGKRSPVKDLKEKHTYMERDVAALCMIPLDNVLNQLWNLGRGKATITHQGFEVKHTHRDSCSSSMQLCWTTFSTRSGTEGEESKKSSRNCRKTPHTLLPHQKDPGTWGEEK